MEIRPLTGKQSVTLRLLCVHRVQMYEYLVAWPRESCTNSRNGKPQEAKYVERWPNTNSAWAGWSRFDIPVERYVGVHSLLICTSSPLSPVVIDVLWRKVWTKVGT